MKQVKRAILLLFLVTMAKSDAFSQNWQLVWSDEFANGISADWVFEIGNGSSGWGNNELEYYRRENAYVQNGQLVIAARRESFGGFNYTSARMKTQGRKSWRYGKIEASIAMPAFQGAWPAFWMLGDNIGTVGWPACGEIDVMEHINTEQRTYGTIHWQDHNGQYAQYGGNRNVNVGAFHKYTIIWDANSIRWFIDDVQFHEANIANGINGTHEFHNNFFILLNFAIGGNWPGFVVDQNAFPAYMYVDYVRVYQSGGTGNPGNPVTIQAENYSAMNGVQLEATTDAGGGQNVGWIDAGDWMAYNSINFPGTGNYRVEYRVASASGGGRLSLDLNAGSIVLGALDVPNTGGWQNWTTIQHDVFVNAGTYNAGVFAQAGGWNLNWIRITPLNGARTGSPALTSALKPDNETASSTFEIYPNPVQQELRINTTEILVGGEIRIFDITGKQVLQVKQASNRVDVSRLPKGAYSLVFTRNGKTITKRFIK